MQYAVELTPENLENALDALPEEEQQIIEDLAARLVEKIKARQRGPAGVRFSRLNALETLAAIGIWQIRQGKRVTMP